jgi:hypothetical protein
LASTKIGKHDFWMTFTTPDRYLANDYKAGWQSVSISGLPDVFFQTKNPNLGKCFRALEWKMFNYFMTIWNNLRIFSIFLTF